SGILGAIASVNSPLYLNEYGTGASERMDINASSMPVVGRALVTYLNTTRNTYVCDNLNASAMSQGKVLDILTGSRELTCSSNDTLLAPRLRGLYNLNLSMLSQFGIAISYDQVYQSEYNGSPCTYVHGMLSGLNGSGELGMCILDSNYIPATIAARFSNSNAHLFLVLNETYIGNGTAFPGSLPGPLT
ncbi:MAG: hypothetical protein KGH50_05000, partial [Candidatus Micrarchaeota archaeon]|nr:hypothetical protein [Candidatus Micrarchaeota archaeon]